MFMSGIDDNDDCDYGTFPLLTYVACKSEKGDCL